MYTTVGFCVLRNYIYVEKSLGWLLRTSSFMQFPFMTWEYRFLKTTTSQCSFKHTLPCCLSNMVGLTSNLRGYLFQPPHSFLIYLIYSFSVRPRISYHVLDAPSYKHLTPSLLSPQLLCSLDSWSGLIPCLSTPFPKLEPKHWFPKLPLLS